MKHVFIIGSRGYHAKYGGWETFVSKLVDNYNDKNTIFHISELSDFKQEEYKINNNIIIKPIYVKYKFANMLICTIKAFKYYLKYIDKNNLNKSYLYILGLKLGPFLKLYKRKIKKLNITTIVNPDGLEHKRSKWNSFVKIFFLLSEKWMLKNADLIICDAKGIKEYLDSKYQDFKKKTIYIAYGSSKIDLKNVNQDSILKEYNLNKNDYLLMIGRLVPENNYELVINEFMKSKINKKLVIISNISSTNYYDKLINLTNCKKDSRIIFIDGVYDELKLAVIRRNAYSYIHGHSVGGTNPSLLESLSLTSLNILYDVNFNYDVGLDSCLYFKEKGTLTKILDNLDQYDSKTFENKAKKIINDNYTWDIVVKKYKKIFK